MGLCWNIRKNYKNNKKMDVTINFEKKTLSKRIGKLLMENVQNDEEKESIKKIMDGKKLQYPQANRLIFSLIAAMIVGDGEEDDDEEEFGDAEDSQLQSSTQNLTQTQTQDGNSIPSRLGEDGKKKTEQGKINDETPRRTDFKDVCRFFKNGNCKFGEKCRNEHPKMCQKFKKNGISKHNQHGCDGKCGLLHLNACRESLKTKECSRSECKFYHLKGTKFTASQETGKGIENLRNEQREKQDSNLVFQLAQMEMLSAIRSLKAEMEEIRMWMRPQNPLPSQPRSPPRMSQENWRDPHGEDNWRSQQTQRGKNQFPRN